MTNKAWKMCVNDSSNVASVAARERSLLFHFFKLLCKLPFRLCFNLRNSIAHREFISSYREESISPSFNTNTGKWSPRIKTANSSSLTPSSSFSSLSWAFLTLNSTLFALRALVWQDIEFAFSSSCWLLSAQQKAANEAERRRGEQEENR